MKVGHRHRLVLAIYPSSRGIAFALFEGPLSPYDWGVHTTHGPKKNASCLRRIEKIFQAYEVDALVIQDTSSRGTRRIDRIHRLNRAIGEMTEERGIPTFAYSRIQVRETFSSQPIITKQTIAETISKSIPAFERYLPPQRRPWMSEHARMALYDAVALVLTHFRTEVKQT